MILTNFLARSSSSVAIKAHGSRLAPAAVRCSYSHWRSLPLWHSNIRQTISHGLWRGRRHKRRGVWTPLDSLSSQLMQWKSDWRDGRLVNWCVCMCVCVMAEYGMSQSHQSRISSRRQRRRVLCLWHGRSQSSGDVPRCKSCQSMSSTCS